MILLDNALTAFKTQITIVTAASTVKPKSFVKHVTLNVVIARRNASTAYLASLTHGEEDAKATNAKSVEPNAANVFIVSDVLFGTGNDWKWNCLGKPFCLVN